MEWRKDRPRPNSINSYPLRRVIRRKPPGQPRDRRLRRVVLQIPTTRDNGSNRRRINNSPTPAKPHQRNRRLGAEHELIRLIFRISFQLAPLATSTVSYARMPALLIKISRRPKNRAASLTKLIHASSVPTSTCVKATVPPSSAANRWPRSPSRSQNATRAPSATNRLTVASPIPDAPPVTAATLPSSRPMSVPFACITIRPFTIRLIETAATPSPHEVIKPFTPTRSPFIPPPWTP